MGLMRNKRFFLFFAMMLFLLMLLGVLPAMGQETMAWEQDPRTQTVEALLTLASIYQTNPPTEVATETPMVQTATVIAAYEKRNAAMTALAEERLTITPTALPLLVEQEFVDGVALDSYCRVLVDEVLSKLDVENAKDFESLLNSFSHVEVKEGMVMDYLMLDTNYLKMPFVYVREEGQDSFSSYEDFLVEHDLFVSSSFMWQNVLENENYLDYLILDGSAEGYVDFLVLDMMVNKFGLEGYALENDAIFLCDATDVERIEADFENNEVEFEDDLRTLILSQDLTPVVEMNEGVVKVRYVTFSKYAGLVEVYYVIDGINPLSIVDGGEQVLVEFDLSE